MRKPLTTLVLATAALAGCANAPRVQGVAPEAPPPLRVWVSFPIGSSQVFPIFTNRDAYVAMFEIIPGRGVTMVYPFYQGHTIASSAHYANLTVQPGRMFYHSDPFGHASFQPRYYYAIASTAPLNLHQLERSLGATRRVLGPMYASYRPYDVIDRLTEIVVPMQSDEDWATDLFVDWPMMPMMPRLLVMPRFASFRSVVCSNGRIIQVAENYPYYGCPGDAAPGATVVAEAKPPVKEAILDAPRAPRRGADREGVELSDAAVDTRRRAEPGARVPTADVRARAPRKVVHHDGRESGRSPVRSSRGTWSASSGEKPAAAGRASAEQAARAGRGQAAEPSGPSRSAPAGETSGKAKKP